MKFINNSRFPFDYAITPTDPDLQAGHVLGGGEVDVPITFTVKVTSTNFGDGEAGLVSPNATLTWGSSGGLTIQN